MAAGSAAVLTNFISNLCVFLGCIAFFSIIRVRPWARRFFAPRRYAKDIDLKPKRLANTITGWIYPVLTYKEEDIIDECGLDCAIYLRILRLGRTLFLFVAPWCLAGVLPTNLTSDTVDDLIREQERANKTEVVNGNEVKFTDFDRYSLSNVEPRSNKLWVHLISVYYVTIVALVLFWKFNKESVLLRLMFLANSERGGPTHTVLVTDIPGISAAVKEEIKRKREAKKQAEKAAIDALEHGQDVPDGLPEALASVPAPAALDASGKPLAAQLSSENDVEMQIVAGGMAGPGTSATATPRTTATGAASAASVTNGKAGAGGDALPQSKSPRKGLPLAIPLLTSRSSKRRKSLQNMRPMSADEVVEELERESVDQGTITIRPEAGVDMRPVELTRRELKRFNYDLANTTLDPKWQAEQKLKRMTPSEMVHQEFAAVYKSSEVAAVNMVCNQAMLEPLVNEYNKIQEALADYLDMLQLRVRIRKGMPHKKVLVLGIALGAWGVKRYGKGFKKVDAVDHWTARLQYLKGEIIKEQETARTLAAPSAFVTFNTRASQSICANSLHHHDVYTWRVMNAPAPFEIVWGSLSMIAPERASRTNLMWVAFWAMAMFFMIPVLAIQAMIEVPKLAKVPGLKDFVAAPGVKQILEAIIPGLALKVFLALVPTILAIMIKLSGVTSLNEIDFGVTQRFFIFQVIVVFFGNIIGGSFFNQVTAWVNDPGSVVDTLGKSIPMTSTFFITYVLINGFAVKSIAFLRLPGFVIYWILSRFAGSPRARTRLWSLQYTNNGTTVSDHMLAMMIGLVFSCINPIVTPAALSYFLVTSITEGYNNIYAFRRNYESAGRLWKTVYNQSMVGVYIMQLTMLGLLGIKKFKYAPLLIPLILGTIVTHITTLNTFARPWSVTALHDAAELDVLEANQRRRLLLDKARKERKAIQAAAKAAASSGDGQQLLASKNSMGPHEALLRDTLAGDVFAMSEEEKKNIAEIYMSPVFKVPLHELPALLEQATVLHKRLTDLNESLGIAKKQGKKLKAAGQEAPKGEEDKYMDAPATVTAGDANFVPVDESSSDDD